MFCFPYPSVLGFSLHSADIFSEESHLSSTSTTRNRKKQKKTAVINNTLLSSSESYGDLCEDDHGNSCCMLTNQLSNKDFVYKLKIPDHLL